MSFMAVKCQRFCKTCKIRTELVFMSCLFYPEDGNIRFLRNIGVCPTKHESSHHWRWSCYWRLWGPQIVQFAALNTLWTGDADLRLYITTVQDGWSKSAFLTRASFPRTTHLITQYMEHFSEWSRWRMFIRGLELVATIYLQLIQNRYIFRSFTVLQCSHQHCVQPVASDVEVVGCL